MLDALREGGGEGDALAPPVVILTSVGDVETVVDAMRRGAADYLTKEATREEIALRVRRSLRAGRMAHEVRRLRRSIARFQDFDEIIGASAAIARVKATTTATPTPTGSDFEKAPCFTSPERVSRMANTIRTATAPM